MEQLVQLQLAQQKVRDQEVLECCLASLLAECTLLEHRQAPLLNLNDLSEGHRLLLELALYLGPHSLVVHRVQQELVVRKVALRRVVPQPQMNLLPGEPHLHGHVALLFDQFVVLATDAPLLVLLEPLQLLERRQDLSHLVLKLHFLGNAKGVFDLPTKRLVFSLAYLIEHHYVPAEHL